MLPIEIACESRITDVTVYARGALVTRSVALPAALPPDATDVLVAGISPLAQVGSARATLVGTRAVVALRARLVTPAAPVSPGVLLERVRTLELERTRLAAEREALHTRRAELDAATLNAHLGSRSRRRVDAAARVGDALAVSALLAELLGDVDARLVALDAALELNARAREAAALAAAQGRSGDLAGAGHPSYTVAVRLAAGDAAVRALSLVYAVDAARWWPAYTARMSAGATRAQWTLGAFVAQCSGEDWADVRLALSTADLVHDARLPELPSLRLGRAQPPARKGYRAPPPGLDAMFQGYDRATAPPRPPAEPAPVDTLMAGLVDSDDLLADHDGVARELAMEQAGDHFAPLGGRTRSETAPGAMPARGAPMFQASAPPPAFARPQPQAKLAAPEAARLSRPRERQAGIGGGGAAPSVEPEVATPTGIEPTDAWLDFDTLVMADASNVARRGRLVRGSEPALAGRTTEAIDAIERAAAPAGACDPRDARGQFDHRYDAQGRADVASTARPHRVALLVADASATIRLRTVPREAAEAYREAEMRNPFGAPLLAGPVDVFVDGALMATSTITAVDRGGTLTLGLGVEDRVRVARNARVDETHAGLLGGSTAVDHAVTVDVTSALGHAVALDVIDRVPVTDDKGVEVTLVASQPAAEPYDQTERGAPVRGGLRWRLELPAGGKARVELRYRITLPAKNEIVGGNRRD